MKNDSISEALARMERRAEIAMKHIKENTDPEKIEGWERTVEHYTCAAESIKEIQQYRAIGTVKECREAMERQRAKKPILCMNEVSGMFVDYADGHGEYKTQMNNWWRCPCCNEVVGQRVIVHKHIHDQRKKNFCEKCRQAILWERDDE